MALTAETNGFLAEQQRSIGEKLHALGRVFAGDRVLSVREAALMSIALHLRDIAQRHRDAVQFIESMLVKQLIAAVGKIVTPAVRLASLDACA